ncbi:hypothetical protein UFOVP1357_9 [uncultured Caudovirales phage]|uniref:Scaffolding protein n=1 Tax=uncultured Caudovirales phage TaxID=2100421 RepID=A0A6J5LGP6_9CAUD|nr:hypothetical protein UFOVP18_5 [uncultured Caudovirales phage]CAB4126605.1 hypothetical protein UFOVP82_7 [uncultured Caudovirales phage]CAB4132712.1 hypothetical protein UFOVP258_56 [uncultured Caudovirales phage]CAB4146618.1 hypothetical protein UFOVP502_48 [uncultured Caudovirales phage]CAB4199714.1 hypothetical protein UFOVP1357_9 [uncultured Caudovirales phage]
MSDNTSSAQTQDQIIQQKKDTDKEYNFRMMEQKLANEKQARLDAEEALKIERQRKTTLPVEDDEEDDDPYIDKKKLNKRLNRFGEETKQQTQAEIGKAVQEALAEERKQTWLKQNGDFYDVLQHAEKFAQFDPELADSILQMPNTFERQKLVYKNIKALGLHQDKPKEPSIQDKVNANRQTPFYQPTGTPPAPYAGTGGDFSPQGQKNAYEKMKELQSRTRW